VALIETGSIVADIRGKVGDEIYSRNRGGSYVKSYAIPANPQTSLQTLYRDYFAQGVSIWAGFSEAVKLRWDSYAEANPMRMANGQIKTYTGRQLYLHRALRGYVTDDQGPSYPTPPLNWPVGQPSISVPAATTLYVNFGVATTSYDWAMIFYISDQLPNTIRSFNSAPQKRVTHNYFGTSPTSNRYSTWNSRYGSGPFVNGRRLFVRYELLHIPSGCIQSFGSEIYTINY